MLDQELLEHTYVALHIYIARFRPEVFDEPGKSRDRPLTEEVEFYPTFGGGLRASFRDLNAYGYDLSTQRKKILESLAHPENYTLQQRDFLRRMEAMSRTEPEHGIGETALKVYKKAGKLIQSVAVEQLGGELLEAKVHGTFGWYIVRLDI